MSDDTTIAIILGLTGITVTWFASSWYHKKASKETWKQIKNAISTLESLELARFRLVDKIDPQTEGELIKKDGKWSVQWNRNMVESVPITDHVQVQVRRWHDDPNGPEFVNGRRGYYTDE